MKAWITNEMIAPSTITDSSFAYKTIQADSIADNAIKTNAITDSSVTNSKIADFSISCGKLKNGSSYIMHYITIEWDNSGSSTSDVGEINFSFVSDITDYSTVESIAKELYHNATLILPCTGYVLYKNPSEDISGSCYSVQSDTRNLILKTFDPRSNFSQNSYTIESSQKVTITDQAVEIVVH